MKTMMTVATIGIHFNFKENVSHFFLKLPEDAEILSVEVRDNKSTLWINYMAPSENFEIDISKEFHFAICKCEYTKFEAKCHKYIGNVTVGSTTYAIFYS